MPVSSERGAASARAVSSVQPSTARQSTTRQASSERCREKVTAREPRSGLNGSLWPFAPTPDHEGGPEDHRDEDNRQPEPEGAGGDPGCLTRDLADGRGAGRAGATGAGPVAVAGRGAATRFGAFF